VRLVLGSAVCCSLGDGAFVRGGCGFRLEAIV
jgi:hypothetical protein